MDLKNALRGIRKLWLLVVGLTIVGAVVGVAVPFLLPPSYSSQSRLYFAFNSPVNATSSELVQANNFAIQKVNSYAQVAESPRVLNRVISDLGMDTSADDLARDVSVVTDTDSVVLTITAADDNPQDAATLAKSVTDNLVDVVVNELESPTTGGAGPLRAEVLEEAVPPTNPTRPGLVVTAGLGLFAGLVIGLVVAVLLTWRDRRVHNQDEVERGFDVPVLGSVVSTPGSGASTPGGGGDLAMTARPTGAEAAGYRGVAAALIVDGSVVSARATAVVASTAGEECGVAAANLAVALAESGLSVLLVDADLHARRATELFGVTDAPGLAERLASGGTASPVRTSVRGLSVVPAGAAVVDAPAPFVSRAFTEFLDEAAGSADIVLVATSPVLSGSDAVLVAAACRSSVLVARAGRVSQDELRSALATLRQAGASPHGVVLTDVPHRGPDSDARSRSLSAAK